MSEEFPDEPERRPAGPWAPSSLLTPPACAIAALVLAIAGLLDQDAVTVGLAAVFESSIGTPSGFYVVRGLATLLQVGVVLLLVRRCLTAAEPREANLARAAVLISGVALVPAALAVLGGAI